MNSKTKPKSSQSKKLPSSNSKVYDSFYFFWVFLSVMLIFLKLFKTKKRKKLMNRFFFKTFYKQKTKKIYNNMVILNYITYRKNILNSRINYGKRLA